MATTVTVAVLTLVTFGDFEQIETIIFVLDYPNKARQVLLLLLWLVFSHRKISWSTCKEFSTL